ncbi:DNA-binding storekeeper protein-related transcriptional regulator [Trema orientale]|uniref:DNA-binding storekeeper protein-related transcriptional regulator n=1 Tax=Trema orientale TaxID=63057 RepID=A0A2P5EFH1_TREOI|nr:DNA-binding storekeeper protein-related transcriptional regulator [Trema orientale]
MAPKRSSHLDDPPAASSSEEEEEASSSSSSEEENDKTTPLSSPAPAAENNNPSKAPDSSSGSESDAESSSDSEPADSNVKPIAYKPMEETPKAKKPRSRPTAAAAATSAGRSAKRPGESEAKDSKRAKKKGGGSEPDGGSTPGGGEDESKKSGGDDSKKLFQRLWSEDDEIVILKGMTDYAAKKGADPSADMSAFLDFIKKSLQLDFTKTQLADKVRRLKKKFENNDGKKKYKPTKPHEEKVFELSKKIWGSEGTSRKPERRKANGTARSSQKANNNKAAELLSSPEALNEVKKLDIGLNASGVSGSLAQFDKSLGELGLPEHAKLILDALKSSDH